MPGGSFKGQFMQTCPKISSATKFAENPLESVDLMSLYFVLLPLIWKCLWQMAHPNALHCLGACRSCTSCCPQPRRRRQAHTQGRVCMCTRHRTEACRVWSKRTTSVNVELMFRSVRKRGKTSACYTKRRNAATLCRSEACGPTARRMSRKAFFSQTQNRPANDEEITNKLENPKMKTSISYQIIVFMRT